MLHLHGSIWYDFYQQKKMFKKRVAPWGNPFLIYGSKFSYLD